MHKIFHYIFATYKRKQVLTDEVGGKLTAIFHEISINKGFEIINMSILIDHVHILIKKNASDDNEYIMKMVKGISSREIFKLYPSNRFELRKLWGRGYRAIEIEEKNQLRQTINYIENQLINGLDKRIAGSREVHSQASMKLRKPAAKRRGFLKFLNNPKPRRSISGIQVTKGAGSREVHSQASV